MLTELTYSDPIIRGVFSKAKRGQLYYLNSNMNAALADANEGNRVSARLNMTDSILGNLT